MPSLNSILTQCALLILLTSGSFALFLVRVLVSQRVLDRLNVWVQHEASGLALTPQQKFLEQFGHQLRQWRIKCGYTRQNLADKLSMNLNQLFCLKARIGFLEDISQTQLSALAALLTKEDIDQTLATLIEHYLILLKK